MRKVHPAETVAHLWAHAAQDEARSPGGKFFFVGPALFSYGRHFAVAMILPDSAGPELAGRVIWNRARYSNTTSRHQSHAFHAMTRQQRDGMLGVPSLTDDDARNLEWALSEKRLPELAGKLVEKVRDLMADTVGKKADGGPVAERLARARDYEKTARAFYQRAGKRYPLPDVPAACPSDKVERAEMVRAFALPLLREKFKAQADAGRRVLAAAIAEAETAGHRDYVKATEAQALAWDMRDWEGVARLARDAGRQLADAMGTYALIHGEGKKPRGMAGDVAKAAELVERAIAARSAAQVELAIASVGETVRRYHMTRHRLARLGDVSGYAGRRADHGATWSAVVRVHDDVARLAPERMPAGLPELAARADRKVTADYWARQPAAYRAALDSAASYGTRYPADAMRETRRAGGIIADIQRTAPEGMRAWLLGQCPRWHRIAEDVARIEAEIAAKHAETLRAWIAGESNMR